MVIFTHNPKTNTIQIFLFYYIQSIQKKIYLQDIFIINMSTVVYFYSSMRRPAAEHKATIMYDFTSSQEKPKNFFLLVVC